MAVQHAGDWHCRIRHFAFRWLWLSSNSQFQIKGAQAGHGHGEQQSNVAGGVCVAILAPRPMLMLIVDPPHPLSRESTMSIFQAAF